MVSNGGQVHLNLLYEGPAGLAGLQFRMISTSSTIRFTEVWRGEPIRDVSGWGFDYSINSRGDTLIVVLWSRTGTGVNGTHLASGVYDRLLSVGLAGESNSSASSSLVLGEVYSVLADGVGNSAGVAVGSPPSVDVVIARTMEAYLGQNYPNPCNPSTLVRYVVPEGGHVSLKVYDIVGREVKTVVDMLSEAGEYQIVLSMDDLPSGAYFYCLSASGYSKVRKLMLVR
jgi:hypothetical protein